MTDKQKADELVLYFRTKCDGAGYINDVLAIECSIYMVEEILKVIPMYTGKLNPIWNFWSNVKFQLEEMQD